MSDGVLEVLNDAVDAVVAALAAHDDWGLSGERAGQYVSDLAADGAALDVLHAGGLRVLSEESGIDPGHGPIAVLDPLDGSTNASRRLPWYATSVCVVTDGIAHAAVVHDHASATRFEAERGKGARRNGVELPARSSVDLANSIIGMNDLPPGRGGWGQFRCFGAAALDLCAVAEGRLDGYVDFSSSAHGPWDYLGGLLVCEEVSVEVRDALGRDLVVTDHAARRAPVAAPVPLIGELLEMRATLTGDRS